VVSNVVGSVNFVVFNPDGSQVVQLSFGTGDNRLFILPALTQTGTYTMMLQSTYPVNTTATISTYNLPANASASLSIGGSTQTLTTTVPGQNALATFTGTAGQSVTVHVTNSTFGGNGNVALLSTDGVTQLTSIVLNQGPNFNLPSVTLPATGTYTIFVNTNPSGPVTGSITLGVTSP
jgi:hypothetical protein